MKNDNIVKPESTLQTPVEEKPIHKNILNQKGNFIVIIAVVIILIIGSGLYFFLNKKANNKQLSIENKTSLSTTPSATPTQSLAQPKDSNTVDKLNSTALIKIPFVRDGSIYLYEDGKEKIVTKSTQKSTQSGCYNLVYPFLSPNGKYLAYIEQLGSQPGYGGCMGGILRIVNLDSGKIKATNYNTSYADWNSVNQLKFETSNYVDSSTGQGIDTNASKTKFIILDPESLQEVASDTLNYSDRDAGLRGFPIFSADKKIRFRDSKYYLVKGSNETLLFDNKDINDFRGWSPDGKYAIFYSKITPKTDENHPFSDIWFAINTDNTSEPRKEIKVYHGAAGGDISTGIKWLFNEAFISYCSQHLSFLDGREPLQLTNSGGGGCHNEEGFVATSPSGEYAFVKFSDRFELRSKSGDKKVIIETNPMAKGRGTPQNLIWINDDYMAIFERTYNADYGTGEKPKIYLFDRKANTVKPLIQNAYLNSSL